MRSLPSSVTFLLHAKYCIGIVALRRSTFNVQRLPSPVCAIPKSRLNVILA